MRRIGSLALIVVGLYAQQEYRLGVSVDLVQVDASVTGADGSPVYDLKPGDYRVLLDGRPQEIRFCNFMRVEGAAGADTAPAADVLAASAAHPEMPPAPLKRENVRRTRTTSKTPRTSRRGRSKFRRDWLPASISVAWTSSTADK